MANWTDYKVHALEAARDFNYGEEVIVKIKKAKTDYEISGIMSVARKAQMEADYKRGKR
jgi:hypothetical protein